MEKAPAHQIGNQLITQALRRNESLKELLEPALFEINAVMEMNKQSRAALSELK